MLHTIDLMTSICAAWDPIWDMSSTSIAAHKQKHGRQRVYEGTRKCLPVSRSSTHKILWISCCSLISIRFEFERIFSMTDCCQQEETGMSDLLQVSVTYTSVGIPSCYDHDSFFLAKSFSLCTDKQHKLFIFALPHRYCTQEPFDASTCRSCSCNASASA